MKDHLDIDERIGDVLRRDLPVPEHREGYRERVAAVIGAEAEARAKAAPSVNGATLGDRFKAWAGNKKWMSWLHLPAGRRVEVGTVNHPRAPEVRRTSGLRITAVTLAVLLLLAGVGMGIFEAVTYLRGLGGNGPTAATGPTLVIGGPNHRNLGA